MNIVVVGGGAAGMMAAIASGQAGHRVVLLEQNEKLGKKIYITGKGRCNVTNDSSTDELMKNVVRNPRFMYSAFDVFNNTDIKKLIEENGCALKTERGNRVFPVSDRASDIIRALDKCLTQNHVSVRLNTQVTSLIIDENNCKGVITAKGEHIEADSVILATGGCSYPTTGSDGKMLHMLEKLGHTVTELRPALVPFNVSDEWVLSLQGLALKNVTLTLKNGKKKSFSDFGEMLFTHFGISGPIALSASSYYEPGMECFLDLKPALSEDMLDARLIKDFENNSNKNFENALDDLFPKRLISVMVGLSGIDPYKKVHQVTGEERKRLAGLIKNLPIHISSTRGFNEAIITRGGIRVKEINPSSMKSKLISGLSFAGEMIDIDALTGGYNLQIAWSTGYLAGNRVEE